MKKIIVLIFALSCAFSASAATSLRNGLYVGAKAGIMRTRVKNDSNSVKGAAFPIALALGLRIYHVRAEAEYTFATKVKKGDFETQTETTLAQVYYDVPLKSLIRPFLNVGVGRHSTKMKEKGVFSESKRGWAYNGGGGFTWSIGRAANFDIGYRFLKLKDLHTQVGDLKSASHMFYIGWRYVF